uniref:Uncharacterized protein n=1 Tax=Spongospora subterranea TaxID=70186 RepID=A0A0H5RC91_9EUKA|eukprot:CRZ11845.1 hypothetical protein [Spongospora subterranea]
MDQIQEFNHRATFDNASRDRRLANVIHRLGELVAHWPEPKSPIDYLLVVPFITRLPEDIITLILSYHHLPDYDKGAILVAALEFALRDPKAALPTLESALASKDLFPL